eukprot:TRINITY_DN108524_c0_g1_i1.p1 TRINITY_DN108524_c0_g1~~TRINITY_DN108524_c0_g1_i1.p1  ORF type:complete len:274 (+),score=38.55 TRINITY_DN108524_c0_g1_i1:31-822(+)
MKTNEYMFKEEIEKSADSALKEALLLIEKEEEFALSLSILISQNQEIIKALKTENRKAAFDEIRMKINLLKMFSKREAIDIQVHNDKMETFLRSWDFDKYKIPLQDFRKGVKKAQETRKPTVSVELGKRLNIKAISPILEDGEIYGSIEVIIGFENIQKELRKKGITFIVLLEKSHLEIATSHKNAPMVDDFVVISHECGDYCKSMIGGFLAEGKDRGVYNSDDFVLGFYPLRGFGGKELGYVGVFFPVDMIESKHIVFKEFL